jgi:Fic family protein
LVRDKSAPRNRTEQEIAGYRDVLSTIHESYDHIYPRPNIILQLHRQLYSFSNSSIGGSYKNSDNFISETDAEGNQTVRFQPVPAYLTANSMDGLCTAFIKSMEENEHDPLLLIPMFVLDFLCIHPFNDGNGRMSRLLTLLLFYRAGYIAGKYISLEKLIENSKDTYYEALRDSSAGWHENRNNYAPFIRYQLGILQKAYNEFEERVEYLFRRGLSKSDRIKAVIDRKIGKVTKKEIMEACPDISKVTVERTLTALVKAGRLVKIGGGRSSAYGKTDEQE